MNKFQPNDLVVMKNTSLCYSGMFNFFKENDLPISVAARFAYYEQPKFDHIYRVICKGKETVQDDTIYCIESADIHRIVYLVGEKAIEKIGVADMEFFDDVIGDTTTTMCFGYRA